MLYNDFKSPKNYKLREREREYDNDIQSQSMLFYDMCGSGLLQFHLSKSLTTSEKKISKPKKNPRERERERERERDDDVR
jgi:hypothetical protein